MTDLPLWETNSYYFVTTTRIVLFFLIFGGITYLLQRKDARWIAAWAGIKSWVLTSPIVFLGFALPDPWPLLLLLCVGILGAKTFFRMTGMYHRSWYVWVTYTFILAQTYLVYKGHERAFNIMPMIFFAAIAMIPLLRNSATHMIQYMGLALMNFIFVGWGYMHLGRILVWDSGPLIVLYLIILFEFCESTNFILNRSFGSHKPIDNITSHFSIEGFLGSVVLTLLLAWGIRLMLPVKGDAYWIAAGLSVSVVGRLGALLVAVIRRDLGIKDTGIFIVGRDDMLSRVDKTIFAAPLFYYSYLLIQGLMHF